MLLGAYAFGKIGSIGEVAPISSASELTETTVTESSDLSLVWDGDLGKPDFYVKPNGELYLELGIGIVMVRYHLQM